MSNPISALDDFFSMTGSVMREACRSLKPFGVDNPEDAQKIARVQMMELRKEMAAPNGPQKPEPVSFPLAVTLEDIEYLKRYANRLIRRFDGDPDVCTFILKTDTALTYLASFLTEDALKKRYPPLHVD